jgi:hypothetical protein
MIDAPTIPETGQPLKRAARVRSRRGIVGCCTPSCNTGTFPARVRAARRALKALELDLASLRLHPAAAGNSNSALLDLRANARSASSRRPCRIRQASSDCPPSARQLPAQKDEPRAAAIATAYLRAVDGDFSAPAFRDLIHALQAHDPLTLDELWNLAAFPQVHSA